MTQTTVFAGLNDSVNFISETNDALLLIAELNKKLDILGNHTGVDPIHLIHHIPFPKSLQLLFLYFPF